MMRCLLAAAAVVREGGILVVHRPLVPQDSPRALALPMGAVMDRDVDGRVLREYVDRSYQSSGRLPLQVAVERRDLALLQLLARAGADPLAQDRNGETCLHTLVRQDDVAEQGSRGAVLTSLLDACEEGTRSALLEVRDGHDETALFQAVHRGDA